MNGLVYHLTVLPIVLPLLAGALLLLFDERRRKLKAALSVAATVAGLGVAIVLFHLAGATATEPGLPLAMVYRIGDWPAPFAIVLVLDRLSALMLVLVGILALSTLIFSLASWQNVGSHFHSLFLLLAMGLNGAFLTGDLFNLFVFFEILLAASYGLVLHGSGQARVRAGLHYIAVNLGGSSLFLIGVALVYGVTGTLNMADIAARARLIGPDDRMLFEAGAAVLGIAFLIKAGMWPLNFWLPGAYSVAPPPMAAFFAIMTKVGVYIVLRMSLLVGSEAGATASFGSSWLIVGGMLTMGFASIGVLAAQNLPRLASHCVLISSGTLLAAVGMGGLALTEGALFYLASSTLTIAAFFMLVELIERGRAAGADVLAVTMEAYGEVDEEEDEGEGTEVGVVIPATMAILGVSFAGCALLIAGLPPLSGFVAKVLILQALVDRPGGADGPVAPSSWVLMALLLVSGFAVVIAMMRAGIRSFWMPLESSVPRVRLIEMAPILGLLLLCVALTVGAAPVMRFVEATAMSLYDPQDYIGAVLPAPPAGAHGDGP